MRLARLPSVSSLLVAALPALATRTTPAWCQQPGEQLTTTGRVKLRTDSTYGSPVRSVLPEGTSVTALAPHSDATGYTKVKVAAHEGWVAGEYLLSATDTSVMLAPAAAACGTACDLERWRVKTLGRRRGPGEFHPKGRHGRGAAAAAGSRDQAARGPGRRR